MSDTNLENREDADQATSAQSDRYETTSLSAVDLLARGDDETGVLANFIRHQPVLTLSLAFGLGLLATSLLTRRKT